MKRGLIILVIFLLSLAAVSALQAEYEPIQNEALPGDSVSYLLHLNNNEESSVSVSIRSLEPSWSMTPETQTITLRSGEKKDVTLSFAPLGKLPPGTYGVKLGVFVNSATRIERLIIANVLDYKKIVSAEFISLPVVDPKRTTLVRLKVKNTRNVALDNMDLVIKSPHFEISQKLSLSKMEQREIELPLRIPENTLKDNYQLSVKISLDNNLMLDKPFTYTVGEYTDVKELIEDDSSFLVSGETVNLRNNGNSVVNQAYTKDFDYIAYKLSSFNPDASKIEKVDGVYRVYWNYQLLPGESKVVGYKVNYRWPTLILILIILAAAFVYVFRMKNSIVISKKVLGMHTHEGGNVHVMKVVINIKNRGNMSVNNVRIIDRVPSTIKAPAQFVSMRPDHIKAVPDGSVMVWDVHNIKRGEEKVISYRIEGKLTPNIVLPSAVAKYTSFGRMVAARSGHVGLGSKRSSI
ncbi:MAG: hypothetical protein AABX19_00555 [Nanoarchaeota archaeon]